MPQVGERRTAQGDTREWTGQGWKRVSPPQVVSPDEPGTSWGGFTRHLLEQEPAARNALLGGAALATGSAPAVFGAPLMGRGLEKLSELIGTGRTTPPSPGELAGDVTQGAVEAFGGKALQAGGRALGAAGEWMGAHTPTMLRSLLRLNPRVMAVEAATSRPVAGAVEEAGRLLTPEGFTEAAGNVARGLTPGASTATPSAEDLEALRRATARSKWSQGREVGYRGPSGTSPPSAPASVTALEDTSLTPFTQQRTGLSPAAFSPAEGRLVPPSSRLAEEVLPAGGLETVGDLTPYPMPPRPLRSTIGDVEAVDLTPELAGMVPSQAPTPASIRALDPEIDLSAEIAAMRPKRLSELPMPEPKMDPGGFPAAWDDVLRYGEPDVLEGAGGGKLFRNPNRYGKPFGRKQ